MNRRVRAAAIVIIRLLALSACCCCANGLSVRAGLPAMQAPWCIRHTQWMPSQASQLPHLTGYTLDWVHQDPTVGAGLLANAVFQSAHVSLAHRLREQARSHKLTSFSRQHRTAWLSVGAGLPAMRAPRYIRHTQWMPSQASQLPHLIEYSFENQVGCQAASAMLLLLPLRSATRPPCFAFDLDLLLTLILGAPLNHAGRTQVVRSG